MIYVVLGTKAQMIKMAPVMVEMQKRRIEYIFIFTGQHKETINELRMDFGVKAPDITLYHGKDITRIYQMIPWAILVLWKYFTVKNRLIKKSQKNIFLVHGDTISTVLGALMGKMACGEVAHLESGLRSFHLFNPFPEELQRLATFSLADIYFCPGAWAMSNLASRKGEKVNIFQNTLLDAISIVQKKELIKKPDLPKEKFCIVSLHRFENIVAKRNLIRVIRLVEMVAEKIQVVFVLHPPTVVHLKKFNLLSLLKKNPSIELRERYSYSRFIQLLVKSEFVITDGGSNQEECYYLGHPCILFRSVTERQEGLGGNVVISKFSHESIKDFALNYSRYKFPAVKMKKSPTEIMIRYLVRRYVDNT